MTKLKKEICSFFPFVDFELKVFSQEFIFFFLICFSCSSLFGSFVSFFCFYFTFFIVSYLNVALLYIC